MGHLAVISRSVLVLISLIMSFVVRLYWNSILDTTNKYDKIYPIAFYAIMAVYSQTLHLEFNFLIAIGNSFILTSLSIPACILNTSTAILWITIGIWSLLLLSTCFIAVRNIYNYGHMLGEIWA